MAQGQGEMSRGRLIFAVLGLLALLAAVYFYAQHRRATNEG